MGFLYLVFLSLLPKLYSPLVVHSDSFPSSLYCDSVQTERFET